MVLNIIFVFILGAIVGSFLNVLILRYGTGRSIVGGRSQCFSCAHPLRWYELIPIFSFLIQGGRCRHCQAKISWQYSLVELVTGILFVLIFIITPIPYTLITLACYLILFSLLIAITVYDLRHQIIPDEWVWLFNGLALILIWSQSHFTERFLAGLGFGGFLALLWLISGGRWMGLGDGKLGLGLGWLLPSWPLAASALVLSFWIGAVVGLLLIILGRLSKGSKKVTIKSEIPFAPFLILAFLLVFFLHLNVLPF